MTPQEHAVNVALTLLQAIDAPKREQIVENARKVLTIIPGAKPGDLDEVVRELESRLAINMGDSTELLAKDGRHQEWLQERAGSIKWLCWARYREYLKINRKLPVKVIDKQDELARKILSNLEDPERKGAWDTRGLVVGHVQSGKTGNYVGLICKAVDAGYKLVIVLSGMHKSLRSQTQERVDEGFLGRDTSSLNGRVRGGAAVGVGKIQYLEKRNIASLTTAHDLGDFKRGVAAQAGYPLGEMPLILVIKKNKSILENLLAWLQDSSGATFDSDLKRNVIANIPTLVIDDEADNASVNTNPPSIDEFGNIDEDADPSAINKKIRQILSTFKKVDYVGYTATPYANIFIYPPDSNPEVGEDLFPRSFIISLHPPDNYVGPEKVFGLQADAGAEQIAPLPVVRPLSVQDYSGYIPDKHKPTLEILDLPPTMKEAILVFILSAAGRAARGQTAVHNSMLIHVTRFTAVQQRVYDLVHEYVKEVNLRLKFNEGGRKDKILDELKRLWEKEFASTHDAIASATKDKSLTPLDWKSVQKFIKPAAQKLVIKRINGTAEDILDYKRHKAEGLTVIAVGGDKLSRGLTLEGLSVSYYLRASRMYDTLMQMGRWFGYRDGYLDLCRLYTSEELINFYQDTTAANAELRREFDNMAAIPGATPQDYGLKVRTSPLGLQITAANKIRHGRKLSLSYSSEIAELYAYKKDPHWLAANLSAAEKLVKTIGKTQFDPKGEMRIARGVASRHILEFFSGVSESPRCLNASPKKLREFIEAQVPAGHLTDWTVAVVGGGDGKRVPLFGFDLDCSQRADTMQGGAEYYMLSRRRLITPTHEEADFEPGALAHIPRKGGALNPLLLRAARPSSRGLLLLYPLEPEYAGKKGGRIFSSAPILGYAVSFPKIPGAREIEYTVNNVFWEQEFSSSR